MSDIAGARERKYSIVLYSDDVMVREAVIGALGSRVAPEMAEHVIHQFATAAALRLFVDGKKADSDTPIDLFILDGESVPEAARMKNSWGKLSILRLHWIIWMPVMTIQKRRFPKR